MGRWLASAVIWDKQAPLMDQLIVYLLSEADQLEEEIKLIDSYIGLLMFTVGKTKPIYEE